jgi:hypothetical protein
MAFRIRQDVEGGWYIESEDHSWRTPTIKDRVRVDQIYLAVVIYGKSAYEAFTK